MRPAPADLPKSGIISLGTTDALNEKFKKHPLPVGASKSLYEMTDDFVFFTPALANLHGAFVDGHFVDLQQELQEPLRIYKHKFYSPIFKNLETPSGNSDWNHVLFAASKEQWPRLEDHICGVTMLSVERRLVAKYGIQTLRVFDPLAADLHTIISNSVTIRAIGIISNTSTLAFKPDEVTPFPIRLPPEPEMQAFLDAFIAGKNPLLATGNDGGA